MTVRRVVVPVMSLLLSMSLLLIAACSSDDSSGLESATTITNDATSGAATGSGLTASTAAGGTTTQSTTTQTTAEETTAIETTAVATTAVATTQTQPLSSERPGSVLDGGAMGAFSTPSGNILCLMEEGATSCWISDKRWTIDQPDAPECAESDWGNVIDLLTDGVSWPCYTDFGFDPDAPALAYGDAMVVGEYRCDSASSGVTCRNGAGQGFTLARAEVSIF